MKFTYVLLALVIIASLILIGVASAATTQINVTAKSLTIASGGSSPQFFGLISANNTTCGTYVTGEQSSLSKTLALLNSIKIGINNVTESNGVISAWLS